MTENEYDLTKSSKALGKLYPILKDKHGNIIDGFHRQNADTEWQSITLDSIDNPVKLELARLATNFCRRTIPKTEFDNRVAFLIKSGMTVQEIADQTGITEKTIYNHMPAELKDQMKADAGRIGGQVSAEHLQQTVKIQDTVQCDRCHVSTSTPVEWHNHNLCQSCHDKAEADPDGFNGYFTTVNKKPQPQVALTTDTPRSLDTWEVRKAQMSPQHSKFEGIVIASLIESGVSGIVQDRRFCVLETIPDIYLPAKNTVIYLDGEAVHSGKQLDRDEQLRDLLKKRTGLKVLSYSYDSNSQKEVERVTKEILENVKAEA